jgi:ABC-type ATPase involved in cell division
MNTRSLAAFYIGNFKAFSQTQRIPLKPITLVFGPNSAGKSSFIQSLALAHEASRLPDRTLDIHHTQIGGRAIELGGFRQYVHRRDVSQQVTWGAELNVAQLDPDLAQYCGDAKLISYQVDFGVLRDDQGRAEGDPVPNLITMSADGVEWLRFGRRQMPDMGKQLRLLSIDPQHPVLAGLAQRVGGDSDAAAFEEIVAANFPAVIVHANGLLSFINLFDGVAGSMQAVFADMVVKFVNGITGAIKGELMRLQYLGPLRSLPPRHIAFAERDDTDWFAGGGFAWDVVRKKQAVREKVNAWLGSSKLKTPYQLKVRSFIALDQAKAPIIEGLADLFGQSREISDPEEALEIQRSALNPDDQEGDELADAAYGAFPDQQDLQGQANWLVGKMETAQADTIDELVLVDQRNNTVVAHCDVGTGISQVLPVLVMAYGSNQQLLAIEQPEIHLHPALQAELGDVFIETALGENQNAVILETHSEHLVLRLLRRIRETSEGDLPQGMLPITPADVCVIYVQPDGTGSKAIEIDITDDGDFVQKWPDGFFAERAGELF